MNRQQRRASRRHTIPGGYLVARPETLTGLDLRCPDCASDVTRWTDSHGIQHASIAHDTTCPTWRSMQ